MAGGGGETEANLEFTPTWIVALVCSVIVIISLIAERSLHRLGKSLKKRKQNALYEALLKIKEELMLLGFISLLLVVSQTRLVKFCVSHDVMKRMLPCKTMEVADANAHYSVGFFGSGRRLLAGGASGIDYCANKGKVPLLSIQAIHDLHIFIFVLAVAHIVFSAITLLLSFAKIKKWKKWEDLIKREAAAQKNNDQGGLIPVKDLDFIRDRYKGLGHGFGITAILYSFFKQFHSSVTEPDYRTMRLGFIMTHCPSNPEFNFYNYMIRALETDFKRVVGISWYLWIFVVAFLLLNVDGWYLYFWVAFIPLVLLLSVGAKLEHVITQLAHDVAEKHVVIEGQLAVKPSDEYFWFGRPRILLNLLHFVLFQNAFETAFFVWIWTMFGINSCIMGKVAYITPRLTIGIFVQLLLSYSTLPLYAIVTQMGSSFKPEIFEDHVKAGIIGWANKAKLQRAARSNIKPRSSDPGQEAVLLQNADGSREIDMEPLTRH